jgi:hypothetical protein
LSDLGYLPPAYIHGRGIVGGPGAYAPDGATKFVGGSNSPGNVREPAPQRVRTGLLNLVLENWLPFTAAFVGRFLGPRAPTAAWQSPFDLDAGERITRYGTFPSADRPFPYPMMIGAVDGNAPLLDQYSLAWSYGKTPSGPSIGTPVSVPFQASYPDWTKVTG